MIQTLRTYMKTLFESISELSLVIDYHKVWVDKYPCLTFEPSDFQTEPFDSCNDTTILTFDIAIQDIIDDVRTRWEVLDNITNALQVVISKLSNNNSLGGNCISSTISSWTYWEISHTSWTVLFVNISLRCEIISFINS